ncbi:hypothetical protein ASD11_17325 [Aeromicrobium sp. Root495]|uniref:DUF305 domain-containing protein n=1 Tax=Aeromicrobium sp. Root495 TaxID=1736550 RepID=UPI0006F1F845|nr:DUF305 domain-containing protein [Aeromicrobium sp. Root495]KQY55312.1 hypothetical protein ASD11_17325 [Aeromicrobium sp. Root495]
MATTTFSITGCSGTGSIRDTYNTADVRFAKNLISAQQRTLTLMELARVRTQDRGSLGSIAGAEAEARAQIKMVAGYIKAWGESPNSTTLRHAAEVDDPLLRGKEEVTALRSLDGASFDRALELTIAAHKRERIARARSQVEDGYDQLMLSLARSVLAAPGEQFPP